jgi:hypothetical protein
MRQPDAWLTAKIQAKYFLDTTVKGHQIDVDTRKGVVTLTGRVDTDQQKQEAERIARETVGVAKVVNNLVVGRPDPYRLVVSEHVRRVKETARWGGGRRAAAPRRGPSPVLSSPGSSRSLARLSDGRAARRMALGCPGA